MRSTLVHPWMTHPHTREPLAALGVRKDGRPIWPIMGASEDDEDEDDEGDGGKDDEDEDEGDDDDPDAGKSPEDLKAELTALRRSQAKLLKEKANRAKGKPKDDDTDDGKGKKDAFTKADIDEMREETRDSVRAELMPAVIRPAAKSALAEMGMVFPKESAAAKAKLTRALKLMDVDALDLDEDGEVAGLDHAVRTFKREYPELFGRNGRTPPKPGNTGGGGRTGDGKPKSATERQAAMLFGGGSDD